MKKLPIGVQSIKKILCNSEFVYVDKTHYIKALIDDGAPYYFVSRPRRFGKSLFINTLEEIFKGNKKLFKGCKIYKSDYDWKEHPVITIDFYQIASRLKGDFEQGLIRKLESIAAVHDLSIEAPTLQEGLVALVVGLSKKNNRVVVLIDEYDHPIISNLKNIEVAEENRDILRDFFGTLKSLDRYLEFTFSTGVTKFSQVSLFSGPNNLKDITMDPRYAGMMGYTEEELKESFGDHIQEIIKDRSDKGSRATEEDIHSELRTWYNGYRFSKGEICVYNPFSTLNYMDQREAQGYWYSTGTPSFLIDQLQGKGESIESFTGAIATKSELSDISRLDEIDLVALMFQTGYLTIQDFDPSIGLYHLGFPNQEVSQAFSKSLLQAISTIKPSEILTQKLEGDLEAGNYQTFFQKINTYFAKIPYHLFTNQTEKFYHGLLAMLLYTAEVKIVKSEDVTNNGRIDLTLETPCFVCIIEIKLDKTAEVAFKQADETKYKDKYLQQGKEIAVIGINFSSKSRDISDFKGALYSSSGKLLKEFSDKD